MATLKNYIIIHELRIFTVSAEVDECIFKWIEHVGRLEAKRQRQQILRYALKKEIWEHHAKYGVKIDAGTGLVSPNPGMKKTVGFWVWKS